MSRVFTIALLGLLCVGFSRVSWAQDPEESVVQQGAETAQQNRRGFGPGGPGRGFGPGGPGRGMRRGVQGPGGQLAGGHGPDERHAEDHEVFQFLLQNHAKITRQVKELPNGVETLTESQDPQVADLIKEHVEWMQYRIENTHPIRMRDPLFAEIFKHTDKIEMVHTDTPQGVRVTETSDDPHVADLIKAHAQVVSKFVERGFAEAMKNHPVPAPTPAARPELAHPVIAGHGAVVRLPDAAMQPRSGTKLLIDITRGGDPSQVNSALDKVAKYLNIYAGGGASPAQAEVAVVLHGDATLTILNQDAYNARFGTQENPNFNLLMQLHEAGVEFYVCGQTLISEGAKPEEVMVFASTAVSALTAVVNLQADGYAYVPLGK